MYCSRCGKKVEQEDFYCGNCGNTIKTNEAFDYQNNLNTEKNTTNTNQLDDYLIDVYIGKNQEKLKEDNFSINTFFLGIYYILYRKMWLLAVLYIMVIMISAIFLPTFYNTINFVVGIIISFKFKKMYIKQVREKVELIKKENSFTNKEELIEICTKKGGTSILAPILYILLILVLELFVS